ncbi:MAG: hypothetical protein VYE68_04450 [Acidobacteriota bacterium]|nr:hypothetical protein [Acidobacteriota bacterium]
MGDSPRHVVVDVGAVGLPARDGSTLIDVVLEARPAWVRAVVRGDADTVAAAETDGFHIIRDGQVALADYSSVGTESVPD